MQTSAETASPDHWRKCNSCKKPIAYGGSYYVCNVSTCNRKRTGLVFCDVSCWDAHVPMMNHRESWAEERKAPSHDEWVKTLSGEDKPARKRAPKEEAAPEPAPERPSGPPRVILRKRAE